MAPRPAPARPKSTDYFNANYARSSPAASSRTPPAADRSYDAGAIVGLAIAKAEHDGEDPAAITEAIPEVVDPKGTPIIAGTGRVQARRSKLIKEGKPIRYEGVIGPVNFDQYGDITGPFRLWKITDGKVTTTGEMSADEVTALKAKLK